MRKRGSITVFLALSLTSVFAAVFAFLEAARVSGLSANAKLSTMQARDAVLASYDRDVRAKYDLMFWQSPPGEIPGLYTLAGLQQETIEGNRKDTVLPRPNYYVLQVHLADVSTPSYQLATDQGGGPFREQAADRMKDSIAEDALSTVLDWLNRTDPENQKVPDLEGEALSALEDLQHAAEASASQNTSDDTKEAGAQLPAAVSPDVQSSSQIEISENPLEWVKKVKKNGIFSLILPEEEMSEKQIDRSACIEKRKLSEGNYGKTSTSEVDNLLFHLYLDKYYFDFTEKNRDHALDYELEYMIAGKESDRANLKSVIRRLLLIREASNLAFLETSTAKQEEVHLIAAALSAAALSPELEPVIQQGVLAAWAYAESVSDLRILMEGGKVSLIKTEEQWHTQLSNLSGTLYRKDAGLQKKGLSYANYLQLLLWTTSEKKLAYRAMDLIEKNTGVRMDQMVARARCEYTYEAAPLFWKMVTLGNHSPGMYRFEDETEISFLKDHNF